MTDELRYDNTYKRGTSNYRVTMDQDYRVRIVFHGRGTVDGTRALVVMLEDLGEIAPDEGQYCSFMDLRDFAGTPIRAQFILGKWLLKNRGRIHRVAVLGARPLEERLGRPVMRIGRMNRISFFSSHEELQAMDWLGWASPIEAGK